jgi:hypothetical protein
MTTLTIPTATTLATLHSTKKEERRLAEVNFLAQTSAEIFDDILAHVCDQIVQKLEFQANNEDAIPSYSLGAGWKLRQVYGTALRNLGLSDEFNALADCNMYKRLEAGNTDHSLNSGFQSFLSTTHSISFSWLDNSAVNYSTKTGHYTLTDSEMTTLNTSRQTFEFFLIDSIAAKFEDEGYTVSDTTSLVRQVSPGTAAIYDGKLMISVS